MNDTIIDITDILSADIKSRSAVSDLALYLKNTNKSAFVIDFAKVKFVTRSFVDEFYNVLLKPNNSGIKVSITNAPEDIQYIFDTVSKTQTKKKNISNSGSVIEFKTVSDAVKYLGALTF